MNILYNNIIYEILLFNDFKNFNILVENPNIKLKI